MAPRALGALLALVAAIAFVVSVASSSWWSGHPNVDGQTITAKDVRVGLLGATGCNTGGDGRCEDVDVGSGLRLVGLIELGIIGLATVLAFLLAVSAWSIGDRRRLVAHTMIVVALLAVAGAVVMLLVGPAIKASQAVDVPIGWGTYVLGAATLAALGAAAITRSLQVEPLRLKPSLGNPAPPPDVRDMLREQHDGLRPSQLGPEPVIRPGAPLAGATLRGSAPLIGGAPQLRPLYDPTNEGYVPALASPQLPTAPPAPLSKSMIDALTGQSTPMPALAPLRDDEPNGLRARTPSSAPARTHAPSGAPPLRPSAQHVPSSQRPSSPSTPPPLRPSSPSTPPPLRPSAPHVPSSQRPSSPSGSPPLRHGGPNVLSSQRPSSPSGSPPLRHSAPNVPSSQRPSAPNASSSQRPSSPSAAPPPRPSAPSVPPPALRAKGLSVPPPARDRGSSVPAPARRTQSASVVPPPGVTQRAASAVHAPRSDTEQVAPRRARTEAGPGTDPHVRPLGMRTPPPELTNRPSQPTMSHAVPPMPTDENLPPPPVLPAARRAVTETDDRLETAMRETEYHTAVEVDAPAKAAARSSVVRRGETEVDDAAPRRGQSEVDAAASRRGQSEVDDAASRRGQSEVDDAASRRGQTEARVGDVTDTGVAIAPAPAGRRGDARSLSSSQLDLARATTDEIAAQRPVTFELAAQTVLSPGDADDILAPPRPVSRELAAQTIQPPVRPVTLELAAQTVLSPGGADILDSTRSGSLTAELAAQRMTDHVSAQAPITDEIAVQRMSDVMAAQLDVGDVTGRSNLDPELMQTFTRDPGHTPIPTHGPRTAARISTAPTNLAPPREADTPAAGPTPACPQCESPMAWVDEHLRFYCKQCRMYF